VFFFSSVDIVFAFDVYVSSCDEGVFPGDDVGGADGCRLSGMDGDVSFDASHGAFSLRGFFGVIAVFFLFAPDGEA